MPILALLSIYSSLWSEAMFPSRKIWISFSKDKNDSSYFNHWRIQGGRQGRAPPRGSKFFHFHAVFGKNVKNNSNFGSWRSPLEKILDPPLLIKVAPVFYWFLFWWKTRMHSSRMRTAHSLRVSPYLVISHACPPGATTHAPPEQPRMPPPSNHACPPRATTHAPRSNHARPPTPVNRITDRCKTITYVCGR